MLANQLFRLETPTSTMPFASGVASLAAPSCSPLVGTSSVPTLTSSTSPSGPVAFCSVAPPAASSTAASQPRPSSNCHPSSNHPQAQVLRALGLPAQEQPPLLHLPLAPSRRGREGLSPAPGCYCLFCYPQGCLPPGPQHHLPSPPPALHLARPAANPVALPAAARGLVGADPSGLSAWSLQLCPRALLHHSPSP